MPVTDLRSDTVTKPTPEMYDAMEAAKLGNDAWGTDPTVNALQARCAALFGKEAALLVPSGTMGNQAALRAWTKGSVAPEIICHERSHIRLNEAAGLATVAGAQIQPLAGEGGVIPVEDIAAAIQPDVALKPETAVIALEQTHNYEGGAVLPLEYLAEVRELADAKGLPVHFDGARVWNAATALDVPLAEVASFADSVQFCFSKGLSCPVGSMVVGSEAFIRDVRKVRQALGGAMRQSGILAACADVALDNVLPRLHEDHERAARLAKGIRDLPVSFREPETNILIVDVSETGLAPQEVQARCEAEHDVLFSVVSDTEVRAVTHREVTDAGIDQAVAALRSVVG